jgi:undecaprenyl-diphosphatase
MLARLAYYDESALFWLFARRREVLNRLMLAATKIGDGYAWAVVAVLMLVFAEHGARVFLQMVAAFAIELSIYKLVKQNACRVRPFVKFPAIINLVHPPDEFSFPSGHTAAAFVTATVVGWAVPLLVAPFFLLAALIGASRVYLAVHYPSDVAAGMLLGIASGMAGIALV